MLESPIVVRAVRARTIIWLFVLAAVAARYVGRSDGDWEEIFDATGLLFGVLVLAWAWGPRDLDVDVEAALDADDPATRRARLDLLAPESGVEVVEGPALAGTVARSALRR